jgi:uncharacterized protein YoxC
MILEIEVGIIAFAAIVLVAFLVWVLFQVYRTLKQAERLLENLNYQLPTILREATDTVHTLNRLAHDLREGTEKAKILGEAIGEIGQTVHQVHGLIRGKVASLALNATGVVAGVRAAVGALIRGRNVHPDGGVRVSGVS